MEGPVERQGRGVDGEGDVRDVQACAAHRHGAHRRRVRSRRPQAVGAKGAVRFRSSSTPPSAPDAPAAGKGAGGGYPHDDALCKWTGKRAGKCADYDWGYRQANGTWALMSSRLFNYRNCTDFAAWATGLSWSSFRFPPDRGHAADWNDYAGNAGLQVARAPAVGDIAGWEAPAPYGHVAIVVAVNANGAVTTVDYNGDGKGNYTVKPNARADWYLRRASGPTTVNNPGPSATPTPTPTPPPPSGPQGGTQVVYGLGSTGAVSHLYYKPGIAGVGQSPLLTTPGTADIAAAPTADGQQVVYTLATDGRLSEVYFRPTVAGTLGQGLLGTLPGVTRIAASRTTTGEQVVYGLGTSGLITELYYKPAVAGTLGKGPLATTPGTVDIAAAPSVSGHQVVYTLGADGGLYEVYFRPGVAGTLGQGKLGTMPGVTRIAAATTAAGEQVVYGLTPSGAVTHLYYKPTVAGTLGQSGLITTPGTVDIATAPSIDGHQVIYTLAADGSLHEIYFKPGVAGTLGTGRLGTLPGVKQIAATTSANSPIVSTAAAGRPLPRRCRWSPRPRSPRPWA